MKFRYLVWSLAALLVCCRALPCQAHNIQLANTRLTQVDPSGAYAMVGFDLGWENSWRDSANWDAAWVFVKYRATGSTVAWSHATLNFVNGTADGHTASAGASITTPSDGKGVFIYRNANGSGNVNFSGTELRWNFAADGVPAGTAVDVRVYAIEMVYVPQGGFSVGDGETDPANTYGNFENGATGSALQITSEGLLTLGGSGLGSLGNNNRMGQFALGGCAGGCYDCQPDGCLTGSGDDFDDTQSQALPAAFPKGFNAFYCMKYEMSQQQLVDMLNTCTPTQQAFLASQTHFYLGVGNPATNRWGITASGNVYSTVEPYLPIIYFDWMRGAAYADWSGLRPMTELEFEKACRGPISPGAREYPWGNSNIQTNTNLTLSNIGATNEGVASGYDPGGVNGNCWINGLAHTMGTIARSGIFAAHASNTGRVTSGGSFWGIMDLGGNCWERAVSVGHPEGRKFTGNHGDGNIDAAGYADVADWPGSFSSGLVNTNVGVGYRGGGLAYPGPNIERNARVSSRRVASGYWDAVIHDDGTRFVRTAP